MRAIFLDIETTGLDPIRHKPIDIALKIVDMTTGEEVASYQSLIKYPLLDWEERDLDSMRINGFTREELDSGKEPQAVAEEIKQLFTVLGIVRLKAVFVCQNPAFDRGFFAQLIDVYTQDKLNWPYHWLDFASMYWTILVKECQSKGMPFPQEINLSKNAIAKKYGLSTEEEPHRAMRGVDHLLLCYRKVVGIS